MTDEMNKNMITVQTCPNCSKSAKYDYGDLTDVTLPDYEGLECPYCNHMWTETPELCEDIYGEDWEEEIFYLKGEKI